jgi:putative serine protease PepD
VSTRPEPDADDSCTRRARGPGRGRLAGSLVLAALVGALITGCTVSPGGDQPESEATSSRAAGSGSVSASPSPAGMRDAPSVAGPRPGESVDWPKVAAAVEASVVSIAVQGDQGSDQGSGEIIDQSGHVLTNNHVVAPADGGGQIQVALSDARVFDAALVGADPVTDLAVLQMRNPPDDVTPLRFGDSEAVEVGQPVMALGNPLGLSHTVTVGIVSALDRPVTTENADSSSGGQGNLVVTNAIQTDAAVNPGNSGGALVDETGAMIGVNSSIATLGASGSGQGGSIGLGFAIPAAQAQWVARTLIEKGDVAHAYLGVAPQDAVVEIDGVRRAVAGIRNVISGTPAAKAGLRSGEAVAEVDGETVASAESLVAQIREREPGSRVVLTVVDRSGDTRQVPVRFGTQPAG